jgi:hypothetical protein
VLATEWKRCGPVQEQPSTCRVIVSHQRLTEDMLSQPFCHASGISSEEPTKIQEESISTAHAEE